MKHKINEMHLPTAVRRALAGACLGGAVWAVPFTTASALELDFGPESELSGSLDMTLKYGVSVRTEDADRSDLVPGFGSLGTNFTSEARVPNRWDVTSNTLGATAELGLDYRNYGVVGTFTYAFDNEIMNGDSIDVLTGEKRPWSDAAKKYAGSNFDTVDLYAYGTFDLEDGEYPLEIRGGKQVINWGEGLFFVDSVAQQVPLNINKLTTPGSELKEAYIGVESLYGQLGIGASSSLEAYYQFRWRRTEFGPGGTFFGSDTLFRGGDEPIPSIAFPTRDPDMEARDDGQWGVAFRTFVGDDIEAGVYYSRYHETWPFVAFNANGESLFSGGQYWPEDLDMYGASFATSVGDWSLNGELAFRPDRPLFTMLGVTDAIGRGQELHDTAHASLHGIWLGKAIDAVGIDSQIALVQLGVDWIDGDTSRLMPQNTITRDAPGVPTTRTPDEFAWGLAGEWAGTWFGAAGPGNDLTLDLFAQYDFSGNSHFWGNFAEKRLLGAVSLTGNFGNALEAGITYSYMKFDKSDYEDQDLLIFNVNYKF